MTIDEDDAVGVDDEETISEQDLRSKLRAAHQDHDKDGLMINGSADSIARQVRDSAGCRSQCGNDADSVFGAEVG